MSINFYQSGNSARQASPLGFAESVTFDEALNLALVGQLPRVTVAYETYGQLNADRDNAILICHAISGDLHVTKHNNDDPGWWDIVVGPGKPVEIRGAAAQDPARLD